MIAFKERYVRKDDDSYIIDSSRDLDYTYLTVDEIRKALPEMTRQQADSLSIRGAAEPDAKGYLVSKVLVQIGFAPTDAELQALKASTSEAGLLRGVTLGDRRQVFQAALKLKRDLPRELQPKDSQDGYEERKLLRTLILKR